MATCITVDRWVAEKVVLTSTTVDSAGDPADPTTLVVTFYAPGETTGTDYTFGVDSEVVKDSTGVYTFTSPTLAAVADGQDVGKVVFTVTSAGIPDVTVTYYRVTTP